MTSRIVDGNYIAREILGELRAKVSHLEAGGVIPRLTVFLVGQNPASLAYVKMKQKRGGELGLAVDVKTYPRSITPQEFQDAIAAENDQGGVAGIIVQLPLPSAWETQKILDTLKPELDVDCLSTTNQQKLIAGQKVFLPPAPAAVLKILEYYDVNLSEANILLLGSGDLIGKPLAAILLHRNLSFEIANRFTEDLPVLTRKADVIISGVGKPGLLTGEMVKEGAVVIDAGTTGTAEGELRGDVDVPSVLPKVGLLSSVPGGVGPVTVACLLQNVVESALDLFMKEV